MDTVGLLWLTRLFAVFSLFCFKTGGQTVCLTSFYLMGFGTFLGGESWRGKPSGSVLSAIVSPNKTVALRNLLRRQHWVDSVIRIRRCSQWQRINKRSAMEEAGVVDTMLLCKLLCQQIIQFYKASFLVMSTDIFSYGVITNQHELTIYPTQPLYGAISEYITQVR